jgi:hypothetical protein
MDAKLTAPKFNANLLAKAYGDNLSTGSSKSGGGDSPLPAALFFQHASARVAVPIGEPTLSDEYPYMDKNWSFWMEVSNPNSNRLTDHDKCVVESLDHIIRHQNADAALLEQLLEHQQANDARLSVVHFRLPPPHLCVKSHHPGMVEPFVNREVQLRAVVFDCA